MDVTGISIAEGKRIEDNSIVGARINEAGQLILKKGDGVTEFNAGQVVPNSWPVGSIFIHTSPTSPATLLALPNSTWERYGKGKALVSVEEGSAEFGGSGSVFGEKKHVQTVNEMPNHNHGGATGGQSANHTHATQVGHNEGDAHDWAYINGGGRTFATSGVQQSGVESANHTHGIPAEGNNAGANVIQPSIAVYVWRRTG